MVLKNKKSQSLTLNTIVITVLVMLVLVVLIAYFLSSTGQSGQVIDNSNPAKCDPNNPAIKALYPKPESVTPTETSGYEKVPGIDCWVKKSS